MSTATDGLAWNAVVYDIPLPRKQRKAALAAASSGAAPSAPDAQTHDVEKSPNEKPGEEASVDVPDWMKGPVGTRRLLSNFKGHVARGEICGIMGASGAGKTTALNVLSARLGSEGTLSGEVLFEGKPRDPTKWKRIVGFVEQDDLMFGNLTVTETLSYAARLRLPRAIFSASQKAERVEETLDMLRLEKCRDTMIGDAGKRGISGGERKRTSIATELVSDVSLLLLDEPTSGLDSFAAHSVVENLKIVAKERKLACLATIHQPSYKVFCLFDRIIILTRGAVYYSGPPEAALEWFEQLGYPIETGANPADYYILIAEAFEKTPAAEARVIGLITSWAERGEAFVQSWMKRRSEARDAEAASRASPSHAAVAATEAHKLVEKNAGNWPTPWIYELQILMHRNYLQVLRDPALLYGTIGQTVALLIIIGFAFFRLDNDQGGVIARIGALFIIPVNASFAVAFPVVATFPLQRAIMTRERSAGLYRTSSAYLARVLVEIPNQVLQRFPFYAILYWMVGFRESGSAWAIWIAINLLQVLTAVGFGFAIGAGVKSVQLANIIAPFVNVIFLLFGSNLLPTNAIPGYFVWLRWISPISYTYSALVINEVSGQEYSCEGSTGQCYSNGQQIIDSYGLGRFTIAENAGFLILLTCVFLLIGYTSLRIFGHPKFRYK